MTHLRSIFARLSAGRARGTLSLPADATTNLAVGVTGHGRKSDLALKIEATGARPGETVAIDEQGYARVLGRKPVVAMDMTNVRTTAGHDFVLAFTPGLPPPLTCPNLYLLYDGSFAMGELISDNGEQWLRSFNPVGMTPIDIAANKILGWAPAGPRRGLFD